MQQKEDSVFADLLLIQFSESLLDLISHPSELAPDEVLLSYRMGGIVETNMQSGFHFPDEGRTDFIGAPTNGDHIIPFLIQVLLHRIGSVMADVDADLLHYSYSPLVQLAGGFGARRADSKGGVKRLQKAVGHLAAATVAGAEYQYLFHRLQK